MALEDVQPGSGELEVYPGSHRLPRLYMNDAGARKVTDGNWAEFSDKVGRRWENLRDHGQFKSMVYRPQRGTVLIWHENLMHAGGRRLDRSLSRRSIVTHNFAEGALVYYDSTGSIGYTFGRDAI
jgi:ectoine hydroxylase-related dioxygenase (phytanoyl-CoA dioxygenase family)